MTGFGSILKLNIKRRLFDGFAVGYNIVFPLIMISLLGFLTRNSNYGGISSYQYYTVVIIPFCIIIAIITAAYAGKDDAYAKTAERVLMAPISVTSISLAKIISCTAVIWLCSVIVYVICSIFTKISFSKIGWVIVMYLALSYAISAIGTAIGLGMKNFLTLKNVINIPIGIFAVLGGSFFRIGSIGGIEKLLMNLSPIRWLNISVFALIYDGKTDMIIKIILILFLTGIIGTILSVITFKKGEYINGILPGYEK